MNIQKHNNLTEWKIHAKTGISYSVIEYPNLFSSDDPNLFGMLGHGSRRLVVVDQEVNIIYKDTIRSFFIKHGIEVKILPIKVTEEHKTIETVLRVLREFDDFMLLRRREPVVCIGGGTLLDVVGFASSIFRRGVPYIRVPTTLVGLVDAGIGVKTGVNFNGHKNIAGTYYQPLVSYIDYTFLKTLNKRHLSNGFAEILKIALIKDEKLFELLEKNGLALLLEKMQNFSLSGQVLRKAIAGMLEELEPNLQENNLERLMDYGHTFSGALEMYALPELLHGEAVSIDMAIITAIAYNRKQVTENELVRIFKLMENLGLPTYHPLCDRDKMYDALLDTTRHRDGMQRLPMPIGIGKAKFVNDINHKEILNGIKLVKNYQIKRLKI